MDGWMDGWMVLVFEPMLMTQPHTPIRRGNTDGQAPSMN
jgi:hypothetical protein